MIKNETKKKVIAKKKKICSSDWCKARGLLFSRRKQDFGLIFVFDREVRASLHMVLMFYPIDVLFLDKDYKVVDIKKGFKPFTFYTSKKKVKYVIELPYCNVSVDIGDLISF